MSDHIAKVVVVGALHHDILVRAERQPLMGETLMGSAWSPKFGGKGGNQAVAAKMAGAEVSMIGAVGNDDFGSTLLAGLESADIDTGEIARLNDVGSGMSVAILDAQGDYAAVVVSGANRSIKPETVAASALWRDASAVILQNEIPEVINQAAIKAARANGATVIWNAAPARTDTLGLMAVTDVLIVNAIEAGQMIGPSNDGKPVTSLAEAADVARALKTDGVAAAIVTMGAAGVAAIGPDSEVLQIAGEPVEATSAHGAGDVFTGVIATALVLGLPFADAIQAANHAAAAHVSGQAWDKVASFRKSGIAHPSR